MIARTEIKWDNTSVPFPIRSTMSVLTLVNKTHNALEEIKKIIGNSVTEDDLNRIERSTKKTLGFMLIKTNFFRTLLSFPCHN